MGLPCAAEMYVGRRHDGQASRPGRTRSSAQPSPSGTTRCTDFSRSRSRRGPVPTNGMAGRLGHCCHRCEPGPVCSPAVVSRIELVGVTGRVGMHGRKRHLRRRLGSRQAQGYLAQALHIHDDGRLGRNIGRLLRRQARLFGIGNRQLKQRQLLKNSSRAAGGRRSGSRSSTIRFAWARTPRAWAN